MEELQKLEELNNLLTSALSEYKKRGQDYAKAYKNYRILVAQELLRLRDSGVPVTICHDLARGKVEVANAKEQEIIEVLAEVNFETYLEYIRCPNCLNKVEVLRRENK